MNEDMLALAVMDDDGYGCAITSTPEPAVKPLPPWQPASNGYGKHPWFLYRDGYNIPFEYRWHIRKNGDLIRYASYETASRAASRLNRKEGE